MTNREAVEQLAEVAFQRGNTDRLVWLALEVALDIRDLLQQIVPPTTNGGDSNGSD